MVELICSVILWVAYSLMEGAREARYFDANPKLPKINIYIFFIVQRLVVLGIIILATNWLLAVPLILMFPFFHDGMYYLMRNELNNSVYPKRFWDNPSRTSTAVMDFHIVERILMLSAAVVILTVIFILN